MNSTAPWRRWVPAGNYAESCRRLAVLGERGLLTPEVQPCESPSELFWFRWLTGHQVCFIVRRLIAQLVDDLNQGCRSADEVLSQISHYVDGYSAMPGGPVQRRRLSASARTAPRRDRATGGHERRLHT
ncbi:hypothetical protein Sgleb_73720 [Streptomyces glebosus]|uniref:Uncharacterized protein n=1 Tax=Streptomyces glebosus TaxID=249580 RepID=A0A640TCC3_9ACTN|nr:hypothetical protein Sgleb_73720 [Streptomyces glebosus]GHG62329.1 hypothetical protein GCM10010513_28940 [Streptomyces glebosus]